MNFVQLYNEKIYDVMAFRYFKEHKLRWHNNGQFFVEGLKSVTVESFEEAM